MGGVRDCSLLTSYDQQSYNCDAGQQLWVQRCAHRIGENISNTDILFQNMDLNLAKIAACSGRATFARRHSTRSSIAAKVPMEDMLY